MFLFLMIIPMILIAIFLFFKILNYNNNYSKEKLSPFECGFDPFSLSRIPFSLKFFFIGIVFLVFDIEIVIILPFPFLLINKNFSLILSFIFINLIILFGLLLEWKKGMIDWLK
uniref:NADH dehydrogenase subunit 3 n=1 Tax=Amblyomma albolimbatum TaxID=1987572 RepID=UPI0030FF3BB3